MPQKTRRTASFIAKDDRGRKYRIDELTVFEEVAADEGPKWRAVAKQLVTAGGRKVKSDGQRRYRILGGYYDIALTSDDPDAVD